MWGTDWKGKTGAGAAAVQPVLGSNRWLLHWKAFLPPWQTPTEPEKLICSSHDPDDSERCLHHNAEQKKYAGALFTHHDSTNVTISRQHYFYLCSEKGLKKQMPG